MSNNKNIIMNNEIQYAYPILLQCENLVEPTITEVFNNICGYKFEIKYIPDISINIILTDTELLKIYNVNINNSKLPLNKLYNLLTRALNDELYYTININNNILELSYLTDMVDINENIIMNEVEPQKTTELLLIDRIKQLDDKVKQLENQINELYYIRCFKSK